MKFHNELERYIHYVSQIDYCYFQINQIAKENQLKLDPITALIDKVTGFDKLKDQETIKNLVYLMGVIIRSKQKLDYDVTGDRKFLNELKKIGK